MFDLIHKIPPLGLHRGHRAPERSGDFGTRCIVLHFDPRKLGLRLSWMLTSFAQEHADRVDLYGYLSVDEAVNAARNWLQKMVRNGHAVK